LGIAFGLLEKNTLESNGVSMSWLSYLSRRLYKAISSSQLPPFRNFFTKNKRWIGFFEAFMPVPFVN
jgi:hypothetical protein